MATAATDGNSHQVGVSEDHPKPNPSGGEADVHRVAHIAVEAHHYQSLWRIDGCGCAAARPTEVPNAPQRHCKSKY